VAAAPGHQPSHRLRREKRLRSHHAADRKGSECSCTVSGRETFHRGQRKGVAIKGFWGQVIKKGMIKKP
jgi:hypothetical protein